jgi:hypothetical protein
MRRFNITLLKELNRFEAVGFFNIARLTALQLSAHRRSVTDTHDGNSCERRKKCPGSRPLHLLIVNAEPTQSRRRNLKN